MSWNNRSERAKFEAIQKKHYEEYLKQGMTEEQIKEMYEFDLEQFNSDRRYYMHVQQLTTSDFDEGEDDESESTLLKKHLEALTVSIETSNELSRYWWIEEIDNPILAANIKKLTPDDLELLTLYVFDGYKQEEIANHFGVTQQAIAKKLCRIIELLKIGL